MSGNLLIALEIILIGMGVVFGSLLILWLVMALLLRFTTCRETERELEPLPPLDETNLKRQAAAAAVAVALAHQSRTGPRPFPLPPTAIVSAWQAVTRANLLRRRGPLR